MKNLKIVAVVPFLFACAAQPQSPDSLRIESQPSGAEVTILGERMGVTPVEVPMARIFPPAYPPEKGPLYGRVLLQKAGCEERLVPVGTRAVSDGLRVKLECGTPPVPQSGDIKARLKRLDELRQGGLVSPEEYAAQRQRILGDL